MGIGIEAPTAATEATVTHHPPGETATDLRVGDFLLTGVTAQGVISRAIKFGAWLRRYPAPYRRFSHAALVVSETEIVEALGGGVERNPISKYAPADYAIVHTHVVEHDQRQLLDFADAVLSARTRYGYTTIAGLAIYCLTGGQLCIQKAGTAICSGFVSDALTRAGFIWPRPPFAMMPADLAKYFDARKEST